MEQSFCNNSVPKFGDIDWKKIIDRRLIRLLNAFNKERIILIMRYCFRGLPDAEKNILLFRYGKFLPRLSYQAIGYIIGVHPSTSMNREKIAIRHLSIWIEALLRRDDGNGSLERLRKETFIFGIPNLKIINTLVSSNILTLRELDRALREKKTLSFSRRLKRQAMPLLREISSNRRTCGNKE